MARKDRKHYIATDPNGKEYETSDLNKFCEDHGLWPSNMRKVARGQAQRSKGWKCRYAATEPVEEKELIDSEKLSEIAQKDERKIRPQPKTEITDPPLNDHTSRDSKITDTTQKELSIPTVDIEETDTNPVVRFFKFIFGIIAIFCGFLSFGAFISIFDKENTMDVMGSLIGGLFFGLIFGIWLLTIYFSRKKTKVSKKDSGILRFDQGAFSSQDSLESLKKEGYANFLKIGKGLVLLKEDNLTKKTYFILFDLRKNRPIDLEKIVTTPGGKVVYSKKIALLAKLYCYAMSKDLIIDENEKAGIATIISGFNYRKREVVNSKSLAMHITLMEMLSDSRINKDENEILKAFRYSLNIKRKDDLLTKESSIMVKIGRFYHDKDYNEVKLNDLKETADKLGCLTPLIEETIDKFALEWFARQCLEGNLPTITVNINLKKNEEAYLAIPVKVLQQKTKITTIRGYAGTRIKIGKIPIYLGGSMPKKFEKEVMKKIGTGTLCVTNNRVILSGTKTNYSIWLEKILQVVAYDDAIQINYEGRYGGRFYKIDKPKLWGVMINSLAARKTRQT